MAYLIFRKNPSNATPNAYITLCSKLRVVQKNGTVTSYSKASITYSKRTCQVMSSLSLMLTRCHFLNS